MAMYQIMKNLDFIPVAGNEYGKVIDVLSRPVLGVIYDPDCFNTNGFHLCVGAEKDAHFCIVYFDDLYLKYFERDQRFCAGVIMHELGHFVNGDHNLEYTEEMQKKRTEMLFSGEVDSRELKADRFAADQLGMGFMIKCIKTMKENRKERGDIGAAGAIMEMDRRIEALEEYRREKIKNKNNK